MLVRLSCVAIAALALVACAQRQPTIFYGSQGPRTGFQGMDFAEADAKCRFSMQNWATTGYGDPFYKALAGGQEHYTSCMGSMGFTPQQAQ